MNLLQVGNTVTIKVKNPHFAYKHTYASYVKIDEFNIYTGTIVNDKTVNFDEIGITGDSRMPIRRIKREAIVMVNESVVDYAKPIIDDRICITVTGSKGDTYVVTKENNRFHCTCAGFSFRRTCKHVQQAFAQ